MKYRYYIDIESPDDSRSNDLRILLECLSYAQVLSCPSNTIRVAYPAGIGCPTVWQDQNIRRMATFGVTAIARRQQIT